MPSPWKASSNGSCNRLCHRHCHCWLCMLARLWSRVILGVPGVELKVTMRARLDPGRPYVFMANHASMVDIWAVFVTIPASFRFIAPSLLELDSLAGTCWDR